MAIYLSRKKGGTVATPITPSNLNPAQMTANVAVNPTANGYAIASYSHKTPSNSSPVALNYGEIDWINGNGYAIQSYTDVTSEDWEQYVLDGQILKVTVNAGDYCVIMNEPDIVTPSNSNPPHLGMNFAYSIRGDNGYLIESYDNVTPSDSSPVALTSGDIVKLGGNGYAVQTAPLAYTPIDYFSDTIETGDIIKFNGDGLIIAPTGIEHLWVGDSIVDRQVYIAAQNGTMISSVTDITPSNSSPVSLSSGTVYKPTANGYAISSYSSKTPSDSSPASVSSGAIIKASSSGYLYKSSGLGKCKAGTFTTITTESQTINLGFQPKYIMVMSEGRTINIYDYSYSSTKAVYATTSTYPTEYTISGNTSNNRISAISSTGFTFNKSGTAGATEYYFAMG